MAKTSKKSGTRETINPASVIDRAVSALVRGDGEILSAERQLDSARGAQLRYLVDACAGISPVTPAEYDRTWKPMVTAKLAECVAAGQISSSTVPVKASYLKTAIVGLSNGIQPLEQHRALRDFVNYAREQMAKKFGIVNKAGRPKADKPADKPADKRTEAAVILARNGDAKLDDATVRRRRFLIETITANWAYFEAPINEMVTRFLEKK
jgi:hypothetical protein